MIQPVSSTIVLSSVSLSAKSAEVALKLMFDVETNPGPNCLTVSGFLLRNSLSDPLLSRVLALVQGYLVRNQELSTRTQARILLRDFSKGQHTLLAVTYVTQPQLPVQSKHSQNESTQMLAERG